MWETMDCSHIYFTPTSNIYPNEHYSPEYSKIAVELLDDYGIEMFKYGTYTPGNAIRYRTLNPGGSEIEGGDITPRKTGKGLPWDL